MPDLETCSERLPCVVFYAVADEDGSARPLWMKGGLEEFFGVDAATVRRDPSAFFDVLIESERTALRAALAHALHAGAPVERRLTLSPAGTSEKKNYYLTARPHTGEDGRPGLVGMIADAGLVADRTELKHSESRFRKAFQASPGLSSISNLDDGRHLDVNDRWLEVLGWRREEVIGRTAMELGVWVDLVDRQRIVEMLRTKGSVRDFETRIRTRNGAVREFLIAGEIIELDGAPRMMLVAHDVTERNQARRTLSHMNQELEARVQARTAALEEEVTRRKQAESRLRAIMNGVADAVVTADAQGRILSFNPAAEKLFGRTAAAVRGTPFRHLMEPASADRYEALLRNFGKAGRSATLGTSEELLAQHADGRHVPVEVALSQLDLGDEELFVAAVRDVSERKEQEALLRSAKEQAEAANLAKSAFLSSMSHELRTPMNAILGFAQLMQTIDADRLSARHREYIDHILSAGRHLLALIDDVLDLAKIEAGRMSLSLEPVAVTEVVEQCIDLLKPLADRFGVTIRKPEPRPDRNPDLQVRADSVRLGQILLNLGSNASKYNRRGGWVAFDYGPAPDRPGYVRITVRDNGPGIPSERIPDLFQPFNRLGAESGPIEGSGIGLSIVRELVGMMGGAVGVESSVGDGTTFWLDLPLAADGDGVAPRLERRSVGAGVQRIRKPEQLADGTWTLLYIDDVSSNIRLMAGVLSRYPGVRMLSAPDAESGLNLVDTHRPDLVVLDINLPDMNGFEFLNRLRAGDEETAGIPVIALTASAGPREIERGRRAGFEAFLGKPLDVGRFLDAANAALARRRQVPEQKA